MAVTAKRLSQSGARGRELEAIVREHLQIIDDKLLRAERAWGRNTLIHDLPVTFALPGLDKRDAQRIVYSSILRSLDKRGFETRILLEDDRTAVVVAWMTDLDSQEVEAMSALIRAKRVSSVGLSPFIERGAMAAPRAAHAVRAGLAPPPPALWVSEAGAVMRPRGGVERAHLYDERDGRDGRGERGDHSSEIRSEQGRGPTGAELELLGLKK